MNSNIKKYNTFDKMMRDKEIKLAESIWKKLSARR